jgi:retron-type reverse transcriptase
MSELLEKILSNDNMNAAYKRVCANKGAGGVDDVTVDKLGDYIKENWNIIREQIRRRQYKPQPVRRRVAGIYVYFNGRKIYRSISRWYCT